MGFLKKKWVLALIAVVIIGAAGSFWAVGKLTGGTGDYLADGKAMVAKGDLASAVIQLRNAVQRDPANGEARLLLGQVYLLTGDYAGAEKEIRAAVTAGVDEANAAVPLAEAYLRQRKYQQILDDIIHGSRGAEIEGRILAYRAYAHLGLGDLDKAEEMIAEAYKIAPNDTKALMADSLMLRARKDVTKSEERVDRALELEPKLIDALLMKAELRRASGDMEHAVEFFGKVIEQQPNNVAARLGRALILVSQNEDDAARADIAVVEQRVAKNPVVAYAKAMLLAKSGKESDAITELLSTGDFLRQYPPGLYLLAYLQARNDQFEQAEGSLRHLLTMVPNEITAVKLLASVYARRNNAPKSIELLSPLVNDETTDSELISLLATAYVRAGRPAEAASLFQRVVEDQPDDVRARAQLAASHLQAGQADTAIGELEGILKDKPDNLQAHVLLVLTHLQKNELDLALDAARELSASVTDSPLGENLAGGILVRKRDIPAAREAFQAALKKDEKFVPALLNLAQIDLAEQKVEVARAGFQQVLEIDGNNIAAMLALSRMAFSANEGTEGVNWLKRAIKARPEATQARLRLVDYYLAARDYSAAMVEARDFSQVLPDNALAIDALGRVQLASGQSSSAVTNFRKLANIAPKAPLSHHRLGQALIEIKNYAEAREELEKAIALSPRYTPAYLSLIGMELRQSRADDALKIAERLREVFPDTALADTASGDILLEAGRPADAVKSFAAAVKKQPTSRGAIRLYQARVANHQDAEAIAGLKDWLKEHGTDNAVRFALASHYLTSGDYDKAVQEHEILYKANSENEVVLNNLAWLYDRRGDKRAVALAEKALSSALQSPAIKDTLGWILYRSGDKERGGKLLREAARVLQNNAEIQYHFAYMLNDQGQREKAREVLVKSLSGTIPDFPEIEDARRLLKSLE